MMCLVEFKHLEIEYYCQKNHFKPYLLVYNNISQLKIRDDCSYACSYFVTVLFIVATSYFREFSPFSSPKQYYSSPQT